jgi:hypothetical protein
MSGDIMSPSNIKIVGNVGEYSDVEALANNLGDPKYTAVIPRLGEREFLIKIGDMEPALLKVDDVDIQTVSDQQLQEKMEPYVKLMQDFCRPEEIQSEEERKPKVRLTDKAKALLVSIAEHPEWASSYRCKRVLKTTSTGAKQVVDELKVAGYVEVVPFVSGGRKRFYYVPLTPAVDWLRSNDYHIGHINLRGNQTPLHRLLILLISAGLRKKGHNVFHDHEIGGKTIDLVSDGTAYEIYTSSDIAPDTTQRINSALANGVQKFLLICADTVLEKMVARVPKSERVEHHLASDFVENLLSSTLDNYTDNQENDENQQESNKASNSNSGRPGNNTEQQGGPNK